MATHRDLVYSIQRGAAELVRKAAGKSEEELHTYWDTEDLEAVDEAIDILISDAEQC